MASYSIEFSQLVHTCTSLYVIIQWRFIQGQYLTGYTDDRSDLRGGFFTMCNTGPGYAVFKLEAGPPRPGAAGPSPVCTSKILQHPGFRAALRCIQACTIYRLRKYGLNALMSASPADESTFDSFSPVKLCRPPAIVSLNQRSD